MCTVQQPRSPLLQPQESSPPHYRQSVQILFSTTSTTSTSPLDCPPFISITPPSSQSDPSFTKYFVSIVGLHRSVLSLISFFEPSIRVSPFLAFYSYCPCSPHQLTCCFLHLSICIFSLTTEALLRGSLKLHLFIPYHWVLYSN